MIKLTSEIDIVTKIASKNCFKLSFFFAPINETYDLLCNNFTIINKAKCQVIKDPNNKITVIFGLFKKDDWAKIDQP